MGSLRRSAGFLLVLCGTAGNGVAHWFLVWLIATVYGAAGLGTYAVVLAGATPIFVFLGFGLRNVYVSLSGAPRWRFFLIWRSIGLAFASTLLAVYCLLTAADWSVFAGMAVMKIADGFSDIALARLQRQGKFTILGLLTTVNAVASILAISIAALLAAPIGGILASTGIISLIVGIGAIALARSHREEDDGADSVGWRRLFSAALPLTLSAGMMSLVASFPIWLLEARSTPEEIGRYTAAAYLIVAANLLGASAQTILITAYRRRLTERGPQVLIEVMTRHTGIFAIASIPALVIVILFGDQFLQLVYGERFGANLFELIAFGVAACLCVLGYLNSTAMLVLNWYRSQLAVTCTTLGGALIPLLFATLIGTTQWVQVAALSLASAYLSRYLSARILLNSRRERFHA